MGQVIGRMVVAPFVAGAASVIGSNVGMEVNNEFKISRKLSGFIIPTIKLAGKASQFVVNNPSSAASVGTAGVCFSLGVAMVSSMVNHEKTVGVFKFIARKFGANT